MGRINLGPARVVAIPRPLRTARNAHGIDTQKVAGRFDQLRRGLRRQIGLDRRRRAVLQQDKRPKRSALRSRGRRFADIVATGCRLLQRRSHIAKLGTGEQIGALGDTRNVGFIHIGGGLIDPFKRLKRVRAVFEIASRIRVTRRLPRCRHGRRCQRHIRRQFERGRHRSKGQSIRQIRMAQGVPIPKCNTSGHSQPVQINIRRAFGMRTGIPP